MMMISQHHGKLFLIHPVDLYIKSTVSLVQMLLCISLKAAVQCSHPRQNPASSDGLHQQPLRSLLVFLPLLCLITMMAFKL